MQIGVRRRFALGGHCLSKSGPQVAAQLSRRAPRATVNQAREHGGNVPVRDVGRPHGGEVRKFVQHVAPENVARILCRLLALPRKVHDVAVKQIAESARRRLPVGLRPRPCRRFNASAFLSGFMIEMCAQITLAGLVEIRELARLRTSAFQREPGFTLGVVGADREGVLFTVRVRVAKIKCAWPGGTRAQPKASDAARLRCIREPHIGAARFRLARRLQNSLVCDACHRGFSV